MASNTHPVLADLGTRGGALLLDLLLVVLALGTVQELGAGFDARPAVLVLALLYFCGMPLTRLQGTLGKWICRARICDTEGRRVGWRAAWVRGAATFVWLALPGLLGEAAKPRWFAATAFTAFCLLVGFMMDAGIAAFQDQERRGRVVYALEQTRPLRERIEAFHLKEKRWPAPAEAGVAEWTPYPAGGGYRLGKDGSVAISFSQVPELKGRTITVRPVPLDGGARLRWDCTADAGLRRSYLPGICRE